MKVMLLAILTALSIVLVASMEKSDRVAFSGRVDFEGRPLSEGVVILSPEEGVVATLVACPVKDGRFHFDRKRGPMAGDYRVEIFQYDQSNKIVPSIPKQFNDNTILKLAIPDEPRYYAEFDLRTQSGNSLEKPGESHDSDAKQ